MGSIQRQVNLIHYNIWRFERWTRFLVFGDGRLTTIANHEEGELRDSVPLAVDPVDESMLPNYSGKHFHVLLLLLLLSIWNVVCLTFGFNFSFHVWFWGAVVCGILTFVADFYLIPIPLKPSEGNILLDEFKLFESMSESKKRVSGFLTFLVVIGIWAVFVLSFVYYLRSLIAAKQASVL